MTIHDELERCFRVASDGKYKSMIDLSLGMFYRNQVYGMFFAILLVTFVLVVMASNSWLVIIAFGLIVVGCGLLYYYFCVKSKLLTTVLSVNVDVDEEVLNRTLILIEEHYQCKLARPTSMALHQLISIVNEYERIVSVSTIPASLDHIVIEK